MSHTYDHTFTRGLRRADLDPDPVGQFRTWFEQALAAGLPEPNAMTVATAAPDGTPSARVVLLKVFDARGFAFFTNYRSRKGRELEANPRAALTFFWAPLERQVRISGGVERTSRAESEEYFRTRPLGSRIGAWASAQSEVLSGREELEHRTAAMERQFAGQEVPLPPHWGGFRVIPESIEFWQGRPNRLHDRFRYTRQPGGGWHVARLAP